MGDRDSDDERMRDMYRKRWHKTQAEFCDIMRINKGNFSAWLNGTARSPASRDAVERHFLEVVTFENEEESDGAEGNVKGCEREADEHVPSTPPIADFVPCDPPVGLAEPTAAVFVTQAAVPKHVAVNVPLPKLVPLIHDVPVYSKAGKDPEPEPRLGPMMSGKIPEDAHLVLKVEASSMSPTVEFDSIHPSVPKVPASASAIKDELTVSSLLFSVWFASSRANTSTGRIAGTTRSNVVDTSSTVSSAPLCRDRWRNPRLLSQMRQLEGSVTMLCRSLEQTWYHHRHRRRQPQKTQR